MMLFEPSPLIKSRIRDRLAEMPKHQQHIWQAVANYDCAHASVIQGDGPFVLPPHRPMILLVGDDLDTSKGVSGFHVQSLKDYLRRIVSATIVSSGATDAAYGTAVLPAIIYRAHVVIIETQPLHEGEWVTFVKKHAPGASMLISTPFTRAIAC